MTPDLLRKAADLMEATVLSAREADMIELMAFHILQTLGDEGHATEQARLLCRLLDEG